MGRAMIIICSAVLISLGIVSMSTSQQGQLLTKKAAEYANEMKAKNMAHTAVQIAMQKINKDPNWAENHNSSSEKWIRVVGTDTTKFYLEFLNDVTGNDYWKADSLRMISYAIVDGKFEASVTSLYLKNPFSSLVPPFTGALQLPTGYESITVDGNAHSIDGTDEDCGESRPPITVASDSTKNDLLNEDLNLNGGEIAVDTTLNYQPTDELIARLKNSPNAVTLDADFDSTLGSPEHPGVFFVEGDVKLTGKTTGYGILVIQGGASMKMEDPSLSVAGNFTFNGLIIFENANLFDGHGTPTINGSVLIGDTEGTDDIDINIGGNIAINYDCEGETYAQKAAAKAVEQYKYAEVATFETIGS